MILVSKFFREVANTMEASHGAFVDLLGANAMNTEEEEVRFIVQVTLLLLRDTASVLRTKLSPEEFINALSREQKIVLDMLVEHAQASSAPHKHAESLARRMEEGSKDGE